MNKKKNLLRLGFPLFLILSIVFSVNAHYSAVTGELRDTKTQALWAHGGVVKVFNCNTGVDIVGDTTLLAGTSSFNIAITPPAGYVPICVQVTFTCEAASGCSGSPGVAAKGPYPSFDSTTGSLNTGSFFSDTGPTAVTLANINPSQQTSTFPIIAAAFFALSSISFVIMRRRRQII